MKVKELAVVLFCALAAVKQGVAQDYTTVHKNAVVVDTHNDVLSAATIKGLQIEKNLKGKTHSDTHRFLEGGVDIQVFSIFCDDKYGKGRAFKFANREIDSLYAIVNRNSRQLAIVTNPVALQQSVKEHKLGCMIGVEGGHMIEDRLDYLDSLYKRGARYLTLTWNNSTSWASSAKDEHNKEEGASGLTEFGKQVVKKMNELGMMVDLSHTGEKTFWDVMAVTTKPVLVSHSSAWALCPIYRNVKDDQLKAIAKNGGVVQVNFGSGFLDPNYTKKRQQLLSRRKADVDSLKRLKWPDSKINDRVLQQHGAELNAIRPPFSLVLDHIDHIVKVAGIDYVGIGADLDGVVSLPKGFNGVEDYPLITKGLLERGYSVSDINKILGGNFIRVFEANCL